MEATATIEILTTFEPATATIGATGTSPINILIFK